MWKQIKSTVTTVLVIQCSYGMSFVRRELYNGLNAPNNIKKIFIFNPPNQVEVDSNDQKTEKYLTITDREV